MKKTLVLLIIISTLSFTTVNASRFGDAVREAIREIARDLGIGNRASTGGGGGAGGSNGSTFNGGYTSTGGQRPGTPGTSSVSCSTNGHTNVYDSSGRHVGRFETSSLGRDTPPGGGNPGGEGGEHDRCPNGETNYPVCNINRCPSNGAINPPACTQCAPGASMVNNQCRCSNNATNPSGGCNICPAGLSLQNNLCLCANGASNPTACDVCPTGSNMVNGSCTCSNGADVYQQCNACRSGQVFDSTGQCRDACSTRNVCGQTIQGVVIGGTCQLNLANGATANDSCIVDFVPSIGTVNPNGSVEFTWKIPQMPGIRSECGFVDLTTPTPRQIPGLQNLDSTVDRARINNIQASTRFCLVCKYYNLLDSTNPLLGEAARHQWVRVIRIGEN